MTRDEVLDHMWEDRKRVGTLTDLARLYSDRLTEKVGQPTTVSVQYLSDVFLGRRDPAGKILTALGLKAELDYRPLDAAE